jgi:hypothetical protein
VTCRQEGRKGTHILGKIRDRVGDWRKQGCLGGIPNNAGISDTLTEAAAQRVPEEIQAPT